MATRNILTDIRPLTRGFALASLMAGATAALAGDGIFGTKSSPMPASTGDAGMGAMPVAQMLVALLVVLALLKWLLPFLLKKYQRKTVAATGGIKIRETAAVGPGSVYLVEVKGKSLLIGATATSVTCLADLTGSAEPGPPTFQDLLDQSIPRPMSTQKEAMGDILSQLERLKHLGGPL